MTKSDRRQCTVATTAIAACIDGQRSVSDTLDDLNGAICLLSDDERQLSLFLRRKWVVLQEIQFYAIYRTAALIPLEHCALIKSTLNEMNTILVERLNEPRDITGMKARPRMGLDSGTCDFTSDSVA